jgi:hypothetical protein
MVWMYSETSCHSGQMNDGCMHAWSSRELRCTKVEIVMIGFNGSGLQTRLTLTVNCTLRSCLIISRAFKILSLRALSMDFGPYNLFLDTGVGGPHIQILRIQSSLDSKIWDLSPLRVSAVHGWAGVAGHLAESLSRISFLRFSLISFHSSFDRARTCRSYFRIWKHWSKHPT